MYIKQSTIRGDLIKVWPYQVTEMVEKEPAVVEVNLLD